MAGIFAFRCATCGEMHEGSPSFSFPEPWHYAQLSDAAKSNAKLDSDLCLIKNDQSTDRFVRAVLELPIHGINEPFLWGVWVSVSKESFNRYLDTWDSPDENDSYFGWFANRLPYYPDTLNLKTHVRPRRGGTRPFLELEQNSHPLAEHLYKGLSLEQAQEIAEYATHNMKPNPS